MVLVGALTVLFAIGVRQTLRTGRGAVWGPRLLGLFGIAYLFGGVLTADPVAGFPPGTTPEMVQTTWQGAVQNASRGASILPPIAASLVIARWFAAEVRMNYAHVGSPNKPALLLIPGQTESWWGYEAAMQLLGEHFEAFAVDLRGQGRSTWTPGRYTLDNMGDDCVRFMDLVIKRPAIGQRPVLGRAVGVAVGVFKTRASACGTYTKTRRCFSSELLPSTGPSIRQSVGPLFGFLNKYLGDQWSIGDWDGMVAGLLRASCLRGSLRLLRRGLRASAESEGVRPRVGPRLHDRADLVRARLPETHDHEVELRNDQDALAPRALAREEAEAARRHPEVVPQKSCPIAGSGCGCNRPSLRAGCGPRPSAVAQQQLVAGEVERAGSGSGRRADEVAGALEAREPRPR